MKDLIREAPVGQLIRWVTGRKYLKYAEEEEGFRLPDWYKVDLSESKEGLEEALEASKSKSDSASTPITVNRGLEKFQTEHDLDRGASRRESISLRKIHTSELKKTSTRASLAASKSRKDLEDAFRAASEPQPPTEIEPQKTADGIILVDWYATNDPANPQNWTFGKKAFVSAEVTLYTMCVYMGASIYSSSVDGVAKAFGVSTLAASGAGLATYVLAYGLGPLVWSPMSEIAIVGRNPPYMISFGIFVILSVPTALADNYAGLLILRLLQGFFGSTPLATGGASMGDLFSILKIPYVLSLWAYVQILGPAIGPTIAGFSVDAEGWRWSLWEILWLAGPLWLVMFFFLPETSTPNILLRRAQRLRSLTGNPNLKSQGEIDQEQLTASHIVFEALYRPIQLIALDPSIAFAAVYMSINYCIFYSFFEVFPLVYQDIYGFNLGELGLVFLAVGVGAAVSTAAYWIYTRMVWEPEVKTQLGAPERRLIPALAPALLEPIGFFWFGWTARAGVPWIVPTIGIAVLVAGLFLVIQALFLYLALAYPQYAASVFAGNDFARSCFAAAAVLFSPPMFRAIGVGPGCSVLGGAVCGCVVGLYGLWWFGDRLRARSRFAAK